MDSITGIVTKIRDFNPETGRVSFIGQLESQEGVGTPSKVMGYFRGLKEGDAFTMTAEWRDNVGGKVLDGSYMAKTIKPDIPKTHGGTEIFLQLIFETSRNRYGITPQAISTIVKKYGPLILKAAVQQPNILVSLSKDPKKYHTDILNEWKSRTQGVEAVQIMDSAGLESKVVDRIINAWQRETLAKIKSNPYMATYIPKVGFWNADKLGKYLGFLLEDRRRLTACVSDVLFDYEAKGSTCARIVSLSEDLKETSGVNEHVLTSFINEASTKQDHELYMFETDDGQMCSHVNLYNAEVNIVNGVMDLIKAGKRIPLDITSAKAKDVFQAEKFSKFDDVQKTAVIMSVCEPISIITGGPGTGKSTVMEAFVELLSKVNPTCNIFLAAPTGKASKRLSETTKRDASTLHSLLRAIGGSDVKVSYLQNEKNPLPANSVVIIDESSMLDTEITSALMKALQNDCKVVFVGDKHQLPSVGPGAVLRDLIETKINDRHIIPCVELIKVYRQDKDSGIAIGASMIREGNMPHLTAENTNGVTFNNMSPDKINQYIENLIVKELPAMGYDPIKDVAILCPQAPGPCGTWEINRKLQAILNPKGASLPGVYYNNDDDKRIPLPKVGDRVMLNENQKADEVVNGDIGIIKGYSQVEGTSRYKIKVEFDSGEVVDFPAGYWRALPLAYANTIHKSQGSQYPVVIMPFVNTYANMNKPLVYTGWTRAQKRLILLGDQATLKASIKTEAPARITILPSMFRKINPKAFFGEKSINWGHIVKDMQAKLLADMKTVTSMVISASPVEENVNPEEKKIVKKTIKMNTFGSPFGLIKKPSC